MGFPRTCGAGRAGGAFGVDSTLMGRRVVIGGGLAAAVLLLILLIDPTRGPAGPVRPEERAEVDGRDEESAEPTPDGEPASRPGGATISGVVLAPDGSPVPGAGVAALCLDVGFGERLEPVETVAGDAGRFRIEGLSPGDFAVRARAERIGAGCLPLVRVLAREEVAVEIRLLPAVAIAGRIVGTDGQPVAGARVAVDVDAPLRRIHHVVHGWWITGGNDLVAATGPDGAFRLAPLTVGFYDVTVEAEGYVGRVVRTIRAPSAGHTIALARGGSIRVVVIARGEPRPARIAYDLFPAGREETIECAGSETEFVIPGVPPGEQTLRVRAVGRAEVTAALAVRPGAEVGPVSLDLPAGTQVRGLVVEKESGRPIPGARVELCFVRRFAMSSSRTLEETVTADAGGRFQAWLRPGEWTAIPSREGYGPPEGVHPDLEPQDHPFAVGAEPVERILHLSPVTAALTGTVRYGDGSPVEGAAVEVVSVDHNGEYEWSSGAVVMSADMVDETDAEGAFRIQREIVPWCVYALLVTGPGGTTAEVEGIRFLKGDREASVTVLRERPAELRGAVRGRVVDPRGAPVAGALVRSAGTSVMTAADGRFHLEGLAEGRFVATYTAVGRPIAYSKSFALSPDRTVDLSDLVLPDRVLIISGRITGIGDDPVTGAHVTVWFHLPGQGWRSVIASTESRDDGTYLLEGPALDSARITVQASGPDYQHQSREVEVEGPTRVDMRLVAQVGITGVVRFSGETPPGLRVQYRRNLGTWWTLDVEWDPGSGVFTATRLPAGRQVLRFLAEGYAPSPERVVDAPEDAVLPVGTVVLTRGGRLTGRVVDASGRPVPGVQVAIKGAFLFTDTAENGTYLLDNVPPGDLVLAVNGLEGREQSPTFPVKVSEGETTHVELKVAD